MADRAGIERAGPVPDDPALENIESFAEHLDSVSPVVLEPDEAPATVDAEAADAAEASPATDTPVDDVVLDEVVITAADRTTSDNESDGSSAEPLATLDESEQVDGPLDDAEVEFDHDDDTPEDRPTTLWERRPRNGVARSASSRAKRR